jgi:acylphosphatase
MIRRQVLIKGKVQGVSFRKSTRRIAEELRLRGWVKNLPSGGVAACFEGPSSSVEAMLAWCFIGPERARVDEVVIRKRGRCRKRFNGFEVRE